MLETGSSKLSPESIAHEEGTHDGYMVVKEVGEEDRSGSRKKAKVLDHGCSADVEVARSGELLSGGGGSSDS